MRAKLRTDLAYQAKDELMMHDCDVVSVSFSRDSELLASGDAKGGVKVWQVSTGKCLRRFKSAHERGVTDIGWSTDCSKIITSSLDGTVRMHGLRSGKTIKFFRGHTAFVQRCLYVSGGIASCSVDGTVRLWDKKTGDLTQAFSLAESAAQGSRAGVAPARSNAGIVDMVNGRDSECLVMCNRTSTVYKLSLTGEILTRYAATDDVEFVAVAVSSLGKFVYGATMSGLLYVWQYETGAEEARLPLTDKETVRVVVHPHLNVLCCLAMDQKALLFRQQVERE